MSKVSSKLAAGVRKVREQQAAAPAVGKRVGPEAGGCKPPGGRDETPALEAARAEYGTDMRPTRVWPD